MAEVAFRPVRQLSEYKGKGASASREPLRGRVSIKNRITTVVDDERNKNSRYYSLFSCDLTRSKVAQTLQTFHRAARKTRLENFHLD